MQVLPKIHVEISKKAPSKGLVKDAGKAGKQVDLKKFQGFISSLRPPEGQKPLANKDAAVNIVRNSYQIMVLNLLNLKL